MKCSLASQLCVLGKRFTSLSLNGCISKVGVTSAPTLTGERRNESGMALGECKGTTVLIAICILNVSYR